MFINSFQGTKLGEKLQTCLFTDFRHTRDVIGLISHKGFEVNKLCWRDAHFFHEVGRGKFFEVGNPFLGNFHNGVFIRQLNQVFITADNGHIERNVCPLCHFIQSTDNIVGFVLAQLIVLNPHGIQHLADKGKLLTELVWSFGTTCLIVRKHLCSESCLPCIKCHQNVSRLNPLHHVIQHQVETINGVGMKTSRTLKPIDLMIECKESTKGYRRAIN